MGEVLGKKIVQYAEDNKGEWVFADSLEAEGECWDLPYMALKESGAKTPLDYGKGWSPYRWSRKKVSSIKSAKPGDIIQYKDFRIIRVYTKKGIKKKLEAFKKKKGLDKDPDRLEKLKEYKEELENKKTIQTFGSAHTAIISTAEKNKMVEVYEQHVAGRSDVQLNKYWLTPGVKKNGTIKIIHKGKFTIYRPEPKR